METEGLLGILDQAKQEAIEELARNFRESNSLNNVKEKRKRYQQQKTQTESQLMHQMQRQLTGAEEGLAMISTAFAKVDELQSHFARIDRLSSRCSRLIHQFPVVKEINRVGRSFRVGTVADWPSSSSPSPPRSQEHFSVSASSYTMQRRSTKVEGREGGRAGKGASERANWMRIPFAPLCDATILCFAVAGTVEHPAGLFDRSASPFPSALLASPFLASPRLASPRLASPHLAGKGHEVQSDSAHPSLPIRS
jgi:hypothetical protein